MNEEAAEFTLAVDDIFYEIPYTRTFLNYDTGLERQQDPVTEQTYLIFQVEEQSTVLKSNWIDHFCPDSF